MKKWRSGIGEFLTGSAGEYATIGVALAIMIMTPILLTRVTSIGLLGFMIITLAATLLGTYLFAQFVGYLRDWEYQRATKKQKRRRIKSKDNLSEETIDHLVAACFRKH